MYVDPNFPTKKALREAVVAGEVVRVFQPGPFPRSRDGEVSVEGPHAPKPHRWYARVRIGDGIVEKVLS